ncbi:MBL fold metallo-hydrolase [Actinotalea sp. JY-7885]|uniref:MBL fold metallo-hydrolase n=1 Tax=Actinotalea sp. JY-7885 TaxID=2758576 RepID=UPI00165D3F29|nr:MBL fold metallo-hydrolase [Actinotalea sp. JY-7885]
MRLTWLGHSTVVLDLAGARVVADPLLRRRAGVLRVVRGPGTAGPEEWSRTAPDAVVLSHLHHDHCDVPTLRAMRAAVVLAPVGAGRWLTGRGVEHVTELAVGQRHQVGGLVVTAVPADHGGRREPFGPTAAAVGHLVESPDLTVWLAGDTGTFAGMARIPAMAVRGVVDVAVVPVWGWGPRLGPGHLDPVRAAAAARTVGARVAIPVHWGTLRMSGMARPMRTRLRMPGEWFLRALADADDGGADAVRGVLLTPGEAVELA